MRNHNGRHVTAGVALDSGGYRGHRLHLLRRNSGAKGDRSWWCRLARVKSADGFCISANLHELLAATSNQTATTTLATTQERVLVKPNRMAVECTGNTGPGAGWAIGWRRPVYFMGYHLGIACAHRLRDTGNSAVSPRIESQS